VSAEQNILENITKRMIKSAVATQPPIHANITHSEAPHQPSGILHLNFNKVSVSALTITLLLPATHIDRNVLVSTLRSVAELQSTGYTVAPLYLLLFPRTRGALVILPLSDRGTSL